MSAHSEFSLIQHYFEQLTSSRDDVLLGIGDDCALLEPPAGKVIAVSIDTLVEGIHFFANVDPQTLGHKSLAVGLSDLAAMGATPAWFTLALTLPKLDETWLHAFSKGLAQLAMLFNIQLVGGDTTRGPLTISIQVHGVVDSKLALRRSGANVGDHIYVTGTLGDAGAALQVQLQQLPDNKFNKHDHDFIQARLEQPTPRVELGKQLLGIASSAIDISDGLVSDLGHILTKSGVGAQIDLAKLPLSAELLKVGRDTAEQLALQSGDDYELCFTVSANQRDELEQRLAGQYTHIGLITNDKGLYFINEQDEKRLLTGAGYDHFKR